MKKRIIFISFNYRDCDAFAEYLHQQSLLGWHFKEFRLGMVFEQGNPADIHYIVEVFPKGTETDTRPEASTEEYAEYCEAAGWKLIDSSRKFCVFRQTEADAVPIVTPEERFANIRKAEWLLWLGGAVPVFLLSAVYLSQMMTESFSEWIFSTPSLLLFLFLPLLCADRIFGGIYLLFWSVTRKKMIAAGSAPVYGKKKRFPLKAARSVILFLVVVAAYTHLYSHRESCLLYLIPLLLILIIRMPLGALISFWRPSRKYNQRFQDAVVWVAIFCSTLITTVWVPGAVTGSEAIPESAEGFPLIQADYRQMNGAVTWTYAEHKENLLGSVSHFYVDYSIESPEHPYLHSDTAYDNLWYTIYQSRFSRILDRLWEDELSVPKDYPVNRTNIWNAVSAVSYTSEHGICTELVRCPDQIWIIHTDKRLNDCQIRSICEKIRAPGNSLYPERTFP